MIYQVGVCVVPNGTPSERTSQRRSQLILIRSRSSWEIFSALYSASHLDNRRERERDLTPSTTLDLNYTIISAITVITAAVVVVVVILMLIIITVTVYYFY